MKKLHIIILVLLATLLGACSTNDEKTEINVPDSKPAGDDGFGVIVQLRQGLITWLADSTKADSEKLYTQYYTYSYQSKDAKGDSVRLTALIGWPDGNAESVKPSTLLIGCHITITDDAAAPTNYQPSDEATETSMLMRHAVTESATSSNALVIIPDYEGYGGTVDRSHPYLCQEITARQVIDAVQTGMKFFQDKGFQMADNYKSITAGYSQGGAVALATHRLIEQSGLADKLHFCGSVCGDGPYDLVATFRQYVSSDKIYMPVVIPLILKGLCEHNQLKGNYQPSDFMAPAFTQTGVLDLISQKSLSTSDINDRLKAYAKANPGTLTYREDDEGDYLPTSQVMSADCIAYLKGESVNSADQSKMDALMRALEANSIQGIWSDGAKWQPQHPMEFFHSVNDEVVPYDNYVSASHYCQSYFNGTSYKGNFLYHHTTAGYLFFGLYCTTMMEEILQGKASATNVEKQ